MLESKPKGWYNGVVDIFDLERMRIHLRPLYCREMMNELLKFNSYKNIALEIKEPLSKYGNAHSLVNLKFTNSCAVNLIKKVSDYLVKKGNQKFNLNKIKENIIAISSYGGEIKIKNPKLPFDFRNKYGAILIASLLHDGGIWSKTFRCHYTNKKLYLHKKIYTCMRKIFGDIPFKLAKGREDRPQLILPVTIGNILVYGLGMISGRKLLNDPEIPKFIFELSSKEMGLFLRQAFDDDGGISSNSSIRMVLNIKKRGKPSRLLLGDKKLLESLGILTSKIKLIQKTFRKGGLWRETWGFNITGMSNLNIFRNKVNFSILEKKKKLQKVFENKKEEHFKWGEVEKIILDTMKDLGTKYGYFTRNLIAKDINRSWCRIQQVIPSLIERDIIKEIKPYSGLRAAKFILSKK